MALFAAALCACRRAAPVSPARATLHTTMADPVVPCAARPRRMQVKTCDTKKEGELSKPTLLSDRQAPPWPVCLLPME